MLGDDERTRAARRGAWGWAAAGALMICTAPGCTGLLGGDGSDGKDPDGEDSEALCATITPGTSPIRRMTRVEYNNTVRDLLGDTSNPADSFVTEEEALGFNNQATSLIVTEILADQYMQASEDVAAAAVAERLDQILPCDPQVDAAACGREFVETFGARAFRRPLSSDEVDRIEGVFSWGLETYDFNTGIEVVIQTILQSPHFLYRVEFGMPDPVEEDVVELTPHEIASRLSYLVWNSMPDDELFDAAAAGELATREQIAEQARRMLDDPKARDAIRNFHDQWLLLDEIEVLNKDASVYPSYSEDLRPMWREETHAFIEHVLLEDDGSVETLFTAPYSVMNATLAEFYGVSGPTGEAYERVDLDPSQRSGLLTQASILAVTAKADQSSPIHRGKFVREQLLCQILPPPPNDVDIELPEFDPTRTTRERFDAHREDPACNGCHELIDPIGYGFEHYDGVGLYRGDENGLPIDASGEIIATDDIDGPFDGVIELGQKLATSEEVRNCVATQWFRYGFGRGEESVDECSMNVVRESFEASGYNIRELIVALTQTDAFRYRHAVVPGGSVPGGSAGGGE